MLKSEKDFMLTLYINARNSLSQHIQQYTKATSFGLVPGHHQTYVLFRTFEKNCTVVHKGAELAQSV